MIRPLNTMMTVFLQLLLLFTVVNCEKGVGPGDLPGIELSVESIGATEVWLRLKFMNLPLPVNYSVERDGQQIMSGIMHKADTILIDVSALPKKSYKYRAAQLMGSSKKIESQDLQVATLDTTSHNILWQVDTLGVRGTIFDVWAFSENDIWAVGEIYIKDSMGNEDPVLYNAARWDGIRWQVIQVPTRIFSGQIIPSIIRTIIGFSPQNVWTFSQAGAYSHWDGNQWETQYVSERQGSGLKLWGLNPASIFLVGSSGSISHYNGTTWRKMESGTTVNLDDIWGIDGNNIWATGTSTQIGRSVVLYFNGGSWSTIYDSFNNPPAQQFGLSSVWTDNNKLLYLSGNGGVRWYNTAEKWFREEQTGQTYVSYRIRAHGPNDILVGGAGGELLHYNGSTWYLYPELKLSGGNGFAFWYSIARGNDVDVVGGEIFTGLFGVPVVVRGSR